MWVGICERNAGWRWGGVCELDEDVEGEPVAVVEDDSEEKYTPKAIPLICHDVVEVKDVNDGVTVGVDGALPRGRAIVLKVVELVDDEALEGVAHGVDVGEPSNCPREFRRGESDSAGALENGLNAADGREGNVKVGGEERTKHNVCDTGEGKAAEEHNVVDEVLRPLAQSDDRPHDEREDGTRGDLREDLDHHEGDVVLHGSVHDGLPLAGILLSVELEHGDDRNGEQEERDEAQVGRVDERLHPAPPRVERVQGHEAEENANHNLRRPPHQEVGRIRDVEEELPLDQGDQPVEERCGLARRALDDGAGHDKGPDVTLLLVLLLEHLLKARRARQAKRLLRLPPRIAPSQRPRRTVQYTRLRQPRSGVVYEQHGAHQAGPTRTP
mmetsp:Transcript_22572/g.63380  ORF Transcript_22572/g.63380 Transcript_22572/m.63380 type:complete len:385 (-) Transcript_22572:1574-2728(-)